MRKTIKIICTILSLAVALSALYLVLTMQNVDAWLTGAFRKPQTETVRLIDPEWAEDSYGLEETAKPCIFEQDGRLLLVAGSVTADITPENINISYYGRYIDFNAAIQEKKNCIVSNDGRFIVYRLIFNEIPYLYYFDVQTQKTFYISDRVDSFDIVENDGAEGLTLIYATGYEQSNKFYIYHGDASGKTAGTVYMILENISAAGVFEAYGAVVYLDHEGNLYKYDAAAGNTVNLASGVESVYFPGDQTYNYDRYYQNFTVCCRKEGRDCILNGKAEAPIEGGFFEVIPKYTYVGNDGAVYYYSLKNQRIIQVADEKETVLYDEIGNIYHVLGYFPGAGVAEPGIFLAAGEASLYVLREDGGAQQELMKLPLYYREHTDLLAEHLQASRTETGIIYINMLTSGSMVLNPKNMNSWLNGVNSYLYGLISVRKDPQTNAFVCKTLGVPASRSMNSPVPVADGSGLTLYASYYPDGSVKAVSLLSDQGGVIHPDILGTSEFAEGQCETQLYPCKSGAYILRQVNGGKREFFYLSGEAAELRPAMDENGILSENYKDFTAAVSFGTLVIF